MYHCEQKLSLGIRAQDIFSPSRSTRLKVFADFFFSFFHVEKLLALKVETFEQVCRLLPQHWHCHYQQWIRLSSKTFKNIK